METAFLADIKIGTCREQLYVSHISDKQYRIEETSLSSEDLTIGTIVELHKTSKGDYRFMKIVEKSSFLKYDWMLSYQFIKSKSFNILKDKIVELNGTYEQIMEGLFYAYIHQKDKIEFEKILVKFDLLKKKSLKSRVFEFLKRKIQIP